MTSSELLAREHLDVTRRFFLGLSAAGLASLTTSSLLAELPSDDALRAAIEQLEYLTPPDAFRMYGRGNPPPHKLPPERLPEVGLTRDTWQLEVIADPDSNSVIEQPLTRELGTQLDWSGLMDLARTRAVRFLHVMTCTNGKSPCGMGLWEGVPLRDVIWMARPTSNVRRVFYYGYHNDDPEQRFQSSLPIGRVLEDPPGEHPVILCYKLNDQWLSRKAGAPVRMIVPDRYGNKSVKWLQRIVLTNAFKANDTYAEWNNDTDSPMKTCARFLHVPKQTPAGKPLAITGLAQVGMSGLNQVQVWICPKGAAWPADDPYFAKADWQDAVVLPPPDQWGGELPDGALPPTPRQIDPETGRPRTWPLRGTLAHWAVLLPDLPVGAYEVRCRTIDANGIAQPMPRPFLKSGHNAIASAEIVVQA